MRSTIDKEITETTLLSKIGNQRYNRFCNEEWSLDQRPIHKIWLSVVNDVTLQQDIHEWSVAFDCVKIDKVCVTQRENIIIMKEKKRNEKRKKIFLDHYCRYFVHALCVDNLRT